MYNVIVKKNLMLALHAKSKYFVGQSWLDFAVWKQGKIDYVQVTAKIPLLLKINCKQMHGVDHCFVVTEVASCYCYDFFQHFQ